MGNDDRGHSALPKLYGAPAYARPPIVPVKPVERPFDPDDLPLEAERMPAQAEPGDQAGVGVPESAAGRVTVQEENPMTPPAAARPFRLLGLGDWFRRDGGARP